MKTWIAIAMLALGCGNSVGDIEDTTDGEEPASEEPIELGTAQQAMVVQVSAGSQLRIMGAPKDEFAITSHHGFRSCDDSAAGTQATCKGHTLTIPSGKSFFIATGTQELADRFNEACNSLVASGAGVSCSAALSGTCTGSMLCVTDSATAGGLSGFDLRNYEDLRCSFVSETRSATWSGTSYTVQRCSSYTGKIDMTAIKAKGASSAEDLRIARMVVNNMTLQLVGVGGTINTGVTQGNRWPYTSVPSGVPVLMTSGQQCRTAALNTNGGSLSFSQSSNCANN